MFDFAEKALKLALRNSEMAEVYIEREHAVEVQVQRDIIDFGKIESMTGVGIRVLKGGRWALHTLQIHRISSEPLKWPQRISGLPIQMKILGSQSRPATPP